MQTLAAAIADRQIPPIPCATIGDHLWESYGETKWIWDVNANKWTTWDMVLVALCTRCRRTPLEVLQDMPVQP
jgi:hypothetical protein